MMPREEYEAAIEAFIRSNGITRCPTACALPTQGTVADADRIALQHYAERRSQSRRQMIARERSFWTSKVLVGRSE
jgi:hypothetical protein